MKILLVNDDGYQSEALMMLKEKMEQYGEVYVVAPEVAMSGKSIGLTIQKSMKLHKRGDRFYSLEGTPADCAAFGLSALDIKFDLLVSGINYGHNISYDTMHSGTCGACIESLSYNTPAIAFSMERNHDFMIDYVNDAMDYILKNNLLSKEYFLNVNFPLKNEVKGIAFTRLVRRNDRKFFTFDGDMVYPKRVVDVSEYPSDTEIYAVANGFISICPLCENVFNSCIYDNIKKEKNL